MPISKNLPPHASPQVSAPVSLPKSPDGGLPPELWLNIADKAASSPKSIARLSGTSHHLRRVLQDHLKLASILGQVEKLRDVDHFNALLSGEEKVRENVTHCVHDLPTDKAKAEALEALGSNLINLYRDPAISDAVYEFNQMMGKYEGPLSTLLQDLKDTAKKALKPENLNPDINDVLQLRESGHCYGSEYRIKNGEASAADVIKEFGIARPENRKFLLAISKK